MDAEEHAAILVPGWRHPVSGKLHIRRDCRAVQFHGAAMTPVLVRFDDERELERVVSETDSCRYCFPGYILQRGWSREQR